MAESCREVCMHIETDYASMHVPAYAIEFAFLLINNIIPSYCVLRARVHLLQNNPIKDVVNGRLGLCSGL